MIGQFFLELTNHVQVKQKQKKTSKNYYGPARIMNISYFDHMGHVRSLNENNSYVTEGFKVE